MITFVGRGIPALRVIIILHSQFSILNSQLLAEFGQTAKTVLAVVYLLAPDGSFHRHKLAERHHALQFRPHDGKAFQWA